MAVSKDLSYTATAVENLVGEDNFSYDIAGSGTSSMVESLSSGKAFLRYERWQEGEGTNHFVTMCPCPNGYIYLCEKGGTPSKETRAAADRAGVDLFVLGHDGKIMNLDEPNIATKTAKVKTGYQGDCGPASRQIFDAVKGKNFTNGTEILDTLRASLGKDIAPDGTEVDVDFTVGYGDGKGARWRARDVAQLKALARNEDGKLTEEQVTAINQTLFDFLIDMLISIFSDQKKDNSREHKPNVVHADNIAALAQEMEDALGSKYPSSDKDAIIGSIKDDAQTLAKAAQAAEKASPTERAPKDPDVTKLLGEENRTPGMAR